MSDLLWFVGFCVVVSLVYYAEMRDHNKWERLEQERQRAKKYLPCPYKRP